MIRMSSLLHNKVVLGILAVLIAGGLWIGLSQSSAPSSSSTAITTANASGSDAAVGQASNADANSIVEVLLALRAVKLEGTIFSEPTFQSLKDFSTAIVPEPVGRPDPFAPNTSVSAAPDTAHTARLFKSK